MIKNQQNLVQPASGNRGQAPQLQQLQLQKIHKEFSGHTVLSDVSLDVEASVGSARTVALVHKGRTELREAVKRVVEQMREDRSLQKALEETAFPDQLAAKTTTLV